MIIVDIVIIVERYILYVYNFIMIVDIPDRELSCVGYWLEDMRSYMITYDLEDAVSKFRCWVIFYLNTYFLLSSVIVNNRSRNTVH